MNSNNNQIEKMRKNLMTDLHMSNLISNPQTIIPATITQPKSQMSQSCDLSDDGLLHLKNTNAMSKMCVSSQINTILTSAPQINISDQFAKRDIKINKNNP